MQIKNASLSLIDLNLIIFFFLRANGIIKSQKYYKSLINFLN